MGAQMTKELGVYNEEEKICTPVVPERYRILHNDPRSVTRGIVRSPIQVESTPVGPRTQLSQTQTSKTADESDIEQSFISEHNEKDCNGSCDLKSELESEHTNMEEEGDVKVQNESPEVKKTFLETDIDSFHISSNDDPLSVKPLNKPIIQLCDVRSPTIEISRTPVLVECTPEMYALQSRIDSFSFCDVDDPSVVVSEDEQSVRSVNQSSVNNWLDNVENNICDTPGNKSFSQSPRQVAKKQKEINALKKQLFFTPDVKELSKPKVRTPLGDIQKNQLSGSPQQLMRNKHWKNIQDERRRLGILDTENTPPSLPPLSQVSSAPGKILDRKRTKIHWDEDTMLI